MAKQSDLIRTNLYISRMIWGTLKAQAFEERGTASEIIDYVVRKYLKDRKVKGEVTLHRKHNEDLDRKPRAVYFDPALWSQLQALSKAENFSIASLVENLLVIYLGKKEEPAKEAEQTGSSPEERDPNRYIRVGEDVYDIGERPIIISASGLSSQDKEGKG